MRPLHGAFFGVLFFLSILFVYAVGAWADEGIWARCTNGERIVPCLVTAEGLQINGRIVHARIYDTIMIDDELNILYKETK